jgi:epsilon-lactone hydrolase
LICDIEQIRPDVKKFLKDLNTLHNKFYLKQIPKKFYLIPKLIKSLKKIAAMNARLFADRIIDYAILTSFFTRKEIQFFGNIYNWMYDNYAIQYERLHPIPPEVKIARSILNGIPAEWNIPESAPKDRVMVYFHGGAYIIGSIIQRRGFLSQLSKRLNMQILSVDYRLAPQFPLPAQFQDSINVYSWLLENNFKPNNIVLAGDSAGGHITLCSLLMMKKDNIPLPAGAILLSPLTDATLSDPSFFDNGVTDPILADVCVAALVAHALDRQKADLPLFSPLFGDLKDLPPMLFIASTCEMIYSDSVRFVEKAKKAGVNAQLKAYDNMIHTFPVYLGDNAPWPEIDESIKEMDTMLKSLFK